MKHISALLLIASLFATAQLSIGINKHFLQTSDGESFFCLGDTAWGLLHHRNHEEAEMYMMNRADKGFTAIQAVAPAGLDGYYAGQFNCSDTRVFL